MESFQPLAPIATAFLSLLWLHLHLSNQQRASAARTQELRAWNGRS